MSESKFPKHLPESEGWLRLECQLKSSERIPMAELLKFGAGCEDAEIGEFRQRGKMVEIIFLPADRKKEYMAKIG